MSLTLSPRLRAALAPLLTDPAVLAACRIIAPHYPISPSQLEQFIQCPRKWAIRYLDKYKTTTKYLLLGNLFHEHLENWLRDGTPIPVLSDTGASDDAARLAAACVVYLPEPGDSLVEGDFKYQRTTARGIVITYTGKIDFRQGPNALLGCKIGDHKSTAAVQWAKTPELLHTDPQAHVYADYGYTSLGAAVVDLQWTYGDKSTLKAGATPEGFPVETTITREQSAAGMLQLDEVATCILIIRLLYSAGNDVPKDPNACGAVGRRCWNLPKCVLHQRPVQPAAQLLRVKRSK